MWGAGSCRPSSTGDAWCAASPGRRRSSTARHGSPTWRSWPAPSAAPSVTRCATSALRCTWCIRSARGQGGNRRSSTTRRISRTKPPSAGVRRIVYLGGLGSDAERLSVHLASRHAVGRAARVDGDRGHRAARRCDHRVGVGQLRNAALSRRALAVHGDAPLGEHTLPTHRHLRHRRAPRPRIHRSGGAGRRVRSRWARHCVVCGDDGALRGRRRPAPTPLRDRTRADPRLVVALGRARHSRAGTSRTRSSKVS